MRTSIKLFLLMFLFVSINSCESDIYEVYEVNSIEVLPVNAQKNKAKSNAQYISILYTNYFQVPIGPSNLLDALNAIRSIGDKQIAFDMIVSKYLNKSPKIPTKVEMDADPEAFIRNTYFRFLTRQPTEAELAWMLNYISRDAEMTPDLVYLAFSTSNEHFYY